MATSISSPLFSEMKRIHAEEKDTPEERRSLQLFKMQEEEHFRAFCQQTLLLAITTLFRLSLVLIYNNTKHNNTYDCIILVYYKMYKYLLRNVFTNMDCVSN